jgi:hypothetical protein
MDDTQVLTWGPHWVLKGSPTATAHEVVMSEI